MPEPMTDARLEQIRVRVNDGKRYDWQNAVTELLVEVDRLRGLRMKCVERGRDLGTVTDEHWCQQHS